MILDKLYDLFPVFPYKQAEQCRTRAGWLPLPVYRGLFWKYLIIFARLRTETLRLVGAEVVRSINCRPAPALPLDLCELIENQAGAKLPGLLWNSLSMSSWPGWTEGENRLALYFLLSSLPANNAADIYDLIISFREASNFSSTSLHNYRALLAFSERRNLDCLGLAGSSGPVGPGDN